MKKKKKVWKCCGKKYKKWSHFLRHRRKNHAEAVARSKHSTQLNTYGQTGDEFENTLLKQHNRCAVCKRKSKLIALSQDHTHFIAKLRVTCEQSGRLWIARNEEFGFSYRSKSRKKAKRMVTLKLKRLSRRGILCWQCNSALRKFLDNYKLLIAAGEYLKKWAKKQGWGMDRIKSHLSHKHRSNRREMQGKRIVKQYANGYVVYWR